MLAVAHKRVFLETFRSKVLRESVRTTTNSSNDPVSRFGVAMSLNVIIDNYMNLEKRDWFGSVRARAHTHTRMQIKYRHVIRNKNTNSFPLINHTVIALRSIFILVQK